MLLLEEEETLREKLRKRCERHGGNAAREMGETLREKWGGGGRGRRIGCS